MIKEKKKKDQVAFSQRTGPKRQQSTKEVALSYPKASEYLVILYTLRIDLLDVFWLNIKVIPLRNANSEKERKKGAHALL